MVFGYLLGMTTLLFMDTTKAERLKKAKEMESVFNTVMEGGHKLVGADRCALWMIDDNKTHLWSMVSSGTKDLIVVDLSKGLIGEMCNSW